MILKWMKLPHDKKHMLVFISTPGIGKSHCVAAMAEWIIETFPFYRYHTEEDLQEKLQNVCAEGQGSWGNALNYLIDDDLIVLDDVGFWWNEDRNNYKDNEWKIEVFYQFLNNRYNSMLPTIITSNLTKEQFEKVYSPRIASRLFAAENTIIKIFDKTQDMRAKGN